MALRAKGCQMPDGICQVWIGVERCLAFVIASGRVKATRPYDNKIANPSQHS